MKLYFVLDRTWHPTISMLGVTFDRERAFDMARSSLIGIQHDEVVVASVEVDEFHTVRKEVK